MSKSRHSIFISIIYVIELVDILVVIKNILNAFKKEIAYHFNE